MELSELNKKIRSANFFPIHVVDEIDEDGDSGLCFDGTLEEYLDAAKALEKKVLYIALEKLVEEDFQYSSARYSIYDEDGNENEDEEENNIKIDLCVINPALKEFKGKIDTIIKIKIFTDITTTRLNFYIEEEWLEKYKECRSEAIEAIKNNREEMEEKLAAAQEAKEEELLKAVRALRHNKDFLSLKTQRAMKAYAMENIPELEDNVDPSTLRSEIQALYDKIRL